MSDVGAAMAWMLGGGYVNYFSLDQHSYADSCSSRPSKRNDAARRNGMMPPTITR
jgi:hypothetical protein